MHEISICKRDGIIVYRKSLKRVDWMLQWQSLLYNIQSDSLRRICRLMWKANLLVFGVGLFWIAEKATTLFTGECTLHECKSDHIKSNRATDVEILGGWKFKLHYSVGDYIACLPYCLIRAHDQLTNWTVYILRISIESNGWLISSVSNITSDRTAHLDPSVFSLELGVPVKVTAIAACQDDVVNCRLDLRSLKTPFALILTKHAVRNEALGLKKKKKRKENMWGDFLIGTALT